MTDQSIEDASRKEFEAYYLRKNGFDLSKFWVNGAYPETPIANTHWMVWQASRQSSQSEPVAIVDVESNTGARLLNNVGLTDGDLLYAAPQQAIPSGWMPIETAPKDGTRILVGHPEHESITAKWNNNTWEHRAGSYVRHTPTHWQNLPASPTAPIESDK
jgi:hypothetical protein